MQADTKQRLHAENARLKQHLKAQHAADLAETELRLNRLHELSIDAASLSTMQSEDICARQRRHIDSLDATIAARDAELVRWKEMLAKARRDFKGRLKTTVANKELERQSALQALRELRDKQEAAEVAAKEAEKDALANEMREEMATQARVLDEKRIKEVKDAGTDRARRGGGSPGPGNESIVGWSMHRRAVLIYRCFVCWSVPVCIDPPKYVCSDPYAG